MESVGDIFLRQAERMQAIAKEMVARPFVAASTDGMVTVSALANGQVVALEIDPRVFRNPDSRSLAQSILATLNSAVSGASSMHLRSLEEASEIRAGSLQDLLEGAQSLADELVQEAGELRRKTI